MTKPQKSKEKSEDILNLKHIIDDIDVYVEDMRLLCTFQIFMFACIISRIKVFCVHIHHKIMCACFKTEGIYIPQEF